MTWVAERGHYLYLSSLLCDLGRGRRSSKLRTMTRELQVHSPGCCHALGGSRFINPTFTPQKHRSLVPSTIFEGAGQLHCGEAFIAKCGGWEWFPNGCIWKGQRNRRHFYMPLESVGVKGRKMSRKKQVKRFEAHGSHLTA